MISSTPDYQQAVVATRRRTYIRAVIDIRDPDISYGAVTSSGEMDLSDPGQIHDGVTELVPYATMEPRRWALNGSFRLFPLASGAQAGFVGDVLSGADGTFSPPVWVQENFSNVAILQAVTLYFPRARWDGVPVDLTVEVMQGGTAYYTKTVTGNTESHIALDGFTVNSPDAIRLTVSKWSMPGRRLRVPELVAGVLEEWDSGDMESFSIDQQANFAGLSLPYGTCNISMDNQDRRFEPRNKQGVFRSIEERQGIPVYIGVELPDGTVEYKPKGVYYQYADGWKTGANDLTMSWALADIVGLVAERQYIPPDTLPTTLSGWVASVVAQLGANFADHYSVDPTYAGVSVTANSVEDVTGVSCGEILRYAAQAAGCFVRADDETGYLTVEPLWTQGRKIDLDNLESYPTIQANDDVAALIFAIYGTSGQETYIVSGTNGASSNTLDIQNPFIHTQAQALTAARLILTQYGGNQISIVGRGDPASEVGDVDTVWLDRGNAVSARRMAQGIRFGFGVLSGCTATLVQPDGAYLFEESILLTESGSWTAPAGVTTIRVVLVSGGDGGEPGQAGDFDGPGANGTDGLGGYVWTGTISINPQQTFQVSIGAGGGPGEPGQPTTFGLHSSANGQRYSPNYVDVASGDAYSRSGVRAPQPNTGDGGVGGKGGNQGIRHRVPSEGGGSHSVVDVEPGPGLPGVGGASGCAIIYWDHEEVTAR